MNRRNATTAIISYAALAIINVTPATARRRYKLRLGRGLRGGTKNYNSSILTQQEIEDCLTMHAHNEQVTNQVAFSEKVMSDRAAALSNLQNELELRRGTVNSYSQAEVDRFNADIAEFEQQRVAYNEAIQGYNDLVQSANQILSDFNARCANKQYYEDDMRAAEISVGLRYNP